MVEQVDCSQFTEGPNLQEIDALKIERAESRLFKVADKQLGTTFDVRNYEDESLN